MSNSSTGPRLRRRHFIIAASVAAGGLSLGLVTTTMRKSRTAGASLSGPGGSFQPNAFIRIAPDGVVTLIAKQMEVGQGVKTSLPMVLAEELDVDWQRVVVEQAGYDPALGSQFSGASSSVAANYTAFRQLGATARAMLVRAAADSWGVRASECRTDHGAVLHPPTSRRLAYGELAAAAAALPVPSPRSVKLKPATEFKLLGTRVGGVDNEKIVTGQPLYGIDVQLPGMLYAVLAKCPHFGGSVVSANLADIKALPGVQDAFVLEGTGGLLNAQPAVAIVARSTWSALKARGALRVEWRRPGTPAPSDEALAAMARARSREPGEQVLRQDGNAEQALASAATRVEAWYEYPFINHAALEPLSCTAWLHEGRLEVWTASQAPEWAHAQLVSVLGLQPQQVRMHLLRAGGAFGRRLSNDYIVEAALVARRVTAPVKLMWSREDDLQHDHFRAAGFHRLQGGIDASGQLVAWHDHYLVPGVDGHAGASLEADEFPGRRISHCKVEQTVLPFHAPMGAWRAPNANVHAWVIQSFLDELALAAKRDPLEFRLSLLARREIGIAGLLGRGSPYQADRMRRVLALVADKSGWGRQLPRGQGQGIAFHASYGGYTAQVAEVTVSPDGQLRVDRVVCVCDVGEQILNLSGAEAQVEGAIIDGLSAAWWQAAPIRDGRAMRSNFHDYRVLRMSEAPTRIEVHFLRSDNPVTGLGETPLPPLAPAVCNAIAQATGIRIRQLPIALGDLSWA